jgi:hypothetical protein
VIAPTLNNEHRKFADLYLAETGIALDISSTESGDFADAQTSELFRAYRIGQSQPIEDIAPVAASVEDFDVAANWKEPGWRKLFHESISMMLNEPPPLKMVEDYLDDVDVDDLQQFCITHHRLEWAMGISVIDAAYLFVEGAYENANIDKKGNLWPVARLTSHGPY